MCKLKLCGMAVLVALCAAGYALVSRLVPEAAFSGVVMAQEAESDFLGEILGPDLKKLMENANAVREALASSVSSKGAKAPSADADSGVSNDPFVVDLSVAPLEMSPAQRQQAMNILVAKRRERQVLARTVEQKLRVYVSVSVERCKAKIAAGDGIGARAACGVAENKTDLAHCRQMVQPVNDETDRLTATSRPLFGPAGSFETDHVWCDLAFQGLDDPGRLLRAANLQLPDSACYAHVDRLAEFARTGTMQSRLGSDDGSVSAYLSYIRRNCAPRIGDEAGQVVDEAKRARDAAAQKPVSDNALPTRAGNDLGDTFKEIAADVNGTERAREDDERRSIEGRAASAEGARRVGVQKANSDRLAAAEQAERERLAAAQTVQARQDFNRKLTTASAGELFALSDEMTAAGKPAESRDALRALVSRFPNHALAVVAAKQMAGAGTTAPAPKPTPAARAVSPAAGASRPVAEACRHLLTELADDFGNPFAPGKPGYATGQTGNHLFESQLWVHQVLVRTANAMPACTAEDRAFVAKGVSEYQGWCRGTAALGPQYASDCVAGHNWGYDEARMNVKIQDVLRRGSGAAAETGRAAAQVVASNCRSLLAEASRILQQGIGGPHALEQAVHAELQVRNFVELRAVVCTDADKAALAQAHQATVSRCMADVMQNLGGTGDCAGGAPLKDEQRLIAAARQFLVSGNGSAVISAANPPPASVGGRPFEECLREEGASGAGRRLEALTAANSGNSNVLTRGIIATQDVVIGIYRKCLPDPRARAKIDEGNAQRAQTLQTCRGISSDPNSCLVSPF